METETITFEPNPETITGTGKYGYDGWFIWFHLTGIAKDGKNPFPYAVAEFTDNSLSATSQQKTRSIVVYVIFGNTGNNYIVIRDNGDGMNTHGLKEWATFALRPTARGITSSFTNGKTPAGSLTSEISSFGVGSKQAAFFIAKSIKMITKRKDSAYVSELCLDKHELRSRAKNNKPVYVEVVTKRKVGDASSLTPQQAKCQTLVDLIESEQGYYDSFSTVLLSDVKKKHLGDKTTTLKKKKGIVRELASQLAHIYYYYLNTPTTDKNTKILEIPSSRPSMYLVVYDENNNNLDAEYKAYKSSYQKFVFKHPTLFFNLKKVDCLERQFVEAAKDHFKFQLSVDNKRQVDVILRYYPNHEEAVMKKIYHLQSGFESDDDEDTESDISYFECFWQGRLLPYSTVKVTSLTYLKPKTSSSSQADQILANCVNRLSGQLFFDSQFSVSREKLRILEDIEHLFSDKTRVMMLERNNEQALRNWLTSCERHNQEFEFAKEKNGQYLELSVKNPSIKLKAGEHLKMSGKHPQLWKVVSFEKPKTKSLGKLWCRREPTELFPKLIGRPLLMLVQKKSNLVKLTADEARAELESIKKKLPAFIEIKMDGKEIPEHASKSLTAGTGQQLVQLRIKDGEKNPVKSVFGNLFVHTKNVQYPEIKQIIRLHGRQDNVTLWGENKPTEDDTWHLKLMEDLNTVGTYTIIHTLTSLPEVQHQFFVRVQPGSPVLIQIDDSIQKYGFQFNTRSVVHFSCHLCDAFGNNIHDHTLLKRAAKAMEIVSDKLNITFSATAIQDQIEIGKITIELKEQAIKSILKSNSNNNNNKRKATTPALIDLDEDVFDLDLPAPLFGVDISKRAKGNDSQAVLQQSFLDLQEEQVEAVDPLEISTTNVHLFDATLQLKKTDEFQNIQHRKIQLQVLSGSPITIRIIEPQSLKLSAENHSSLKEKLHLIVLDNNGLAATVEKLNQTFFIEVSCPYIKKKQFQLTSPSLVVPSQDIVFEGKALTGQVSTELMISLKKDNEPTIFVHSIPVTLQPSNKATILELTAERMTLRQEPDAEENIPTYSAKATAESLLDFTLMVKNEMGQYVRKQQAMVKGLHSTLFKPLKSNGKLGTITTPTTAKMETFTISYKDVENAKLNCILKLYIMPKPPTRWMLETTQKKHAEGFIVPIGTYFPQMRILAFDEHQNEVPEELRVQQPFVKIEHDTEAMYPLSDHEIQDLTSGTFRFAGKVGSYRLTLYGGNLSESIVKFTLAPGTASLYSCDILGDPDHLKLNCPTQEGSVGADTGREVSLAISRYMCIGLIQVFLCDQQGNTLEMKAKNKPRIKILKPASCEIVQEKFSYQNNSVLIEDLGIAASPGTYQLQIADTANHTVKHAMLNLEVSDRSDRAVDMNLSFQAESLDANQLLCTELWPVLKVQLRFEAPTDNMQSPPASSLLLNLHGSTQLPYLSEPVPSDTEPNTYYFITNQRWQGKPIEKACSVMFDVMYTEQRNLKYALQPAERQVTRSIELTILPAKANPNKLEIEYLPKPIPDKFVSNSSHQRQIFDSIKIIVLDKFNNHVKQHNIEYVDLVLEREDRIGNETDYPQLENPTDSPIHRYPFENGECAISKICLKQGVGTLEGMYILNLMPISKEASGLQPICVKLHFRQQLQLNRQPNQEQSKLIVQLENLMQNKLSLEGRLQQKILGGNAIPIHPDNLLRDIQAYIEELNKRKKDMIVNGDKNRVVAKIPDQRPIDSLPNHLKSHAIGWIAHLGTVENANIAKILSWNLHKAMKTFLVKSTEAKKILYQAGISVLSLDTVVHRDSSINPSDPGSPRLAADLIVCQEDYRKLWKSLLRGTVVVPTNNDAMTYQQHLASHSKQASMILSLEGGRFDSSGIADPNDKAPQDLQQLRSYLGTTPITQSAAYLRLENELTRIENDNWTVQIQQLRTTLGSIVNLQKQLGMEQLTVPEFQYTSFLQTRQDNQHANQSQQQYNTQYAQYPYPQQYYNQQSHNNYNAQQYNNDNNNNNNDRSKRQRT